MAGQCLDELLYEAIELVRNHLPLLTQSPDQVTND
jgi:hypothetical protein